jgi:hypothetical protein
MHTLTWNSVRTGKSKTLRGNWSQLQLKMWLIRNVTPNQNFWIDGVPH